MSAAAWLVAGSFGYVYCVLIPLQNVPVQPIAFACSPFSCPKTLSLKVQLYPFIPHCPMCPLAFLNACPLFAADVRPRWYPVVPNKRAGGLANVK